MSNELQEFHGGDMTVVRENVPMIADDNIVALAEQAEKRLAAVNKIMTVSLKITTPHDWCLIGGKPYLQESGAAKVARLFGVSWRVHEPKKETRGDGHYTFSYRGEFSFGGSTIEADGMRSSSDEFFTGKDKLDKDGKIIKPKKTPDEIDVRDVKLAAYTNCINNGIKRLVPGLRNITVETLQEAGFDVGKISGYGFNSGTPQAESEESADKRAEIMRMLMECCEGDISKVKTMLKKCTSFTKTDGTVYEGKDDVSKLTEKQIVPTYGKVKKGYEEWKAKQGNGTPPEQPQNTDEEDIF